MLLNKLYRKTATGAIQFWEINVTEQKDGFGLITIIYGQVGSDCPQIVKEVIRDGKNIGKKNETSPYQQAIRDAISKWEYQKKKKGYVESEEAARNDEVDSIVKGGVFPMLAHKFENFSSKLEYPVYVQPKIDGHRCIAVVKNGVCTLWSRTRKPITSLPHINKSIEKLIGNNDIILDGELYNHEYCNNFEQITKLIRPIEPVDGHEKVQYHIYDTVVENKTFKERNEMLNRIFTFNVVEHLKNVETNLIDNEQDLYTKFDNYLSNGYEGAMVRGVNGLYEGHPTRRSPDLLKVKKFDDAEFEIVDVVQGNGKMEGKAIFVCKSGSELFESVMNCSMGELSTLWNKRKELIGKQVTVQYQGFTSKKNVPRFPRVLRIREDL